MPEITPSPPTVDLAKAEWWMRYVAQQDPPSDTSEAFRLVIEELDQLRAQRDAALALHVRADPQGGLPHCRECVDEWPCPTVMALGALCCDLHGRNCEPPSELCCSACTESAHPQHADGSACSNPDLSSAPPRA